MSIDEITFPDARRQLVREVLVAAVEADLATPWWRRRPVVVGAVATALLVPAGVATANWAWQEVEDTGSVRCLTSTDLDAEKIFLTSTDGPDGLPVEFERPIAACGDLWSQGVLRPGEDDAQPPTPAAGLPVPQLAACVVENDGRRYVAVIPGDEEVVCRELGLPRWLR